MNKVAGLHQQYNGESKILNELQIPQKYYQSKGEIRLKRGE